MPLLDLEKESYKKLKKTQSQFIQVSKLAAIGEFSGGVAHEINNPLAGILGFSQRLRQKFGSKGIKNVADLKEFPEDLDMIIESAQRCKKIVDALLNFSRMKPPQFDSVNLVELIDTTLLFMYNKIDQKKILVDKKMNSNRIDIVGDENQLQQVFTNIFLNAIQFMSEGGKLTIETTKQDENIEVSISDTGSGISEENLSRIFDPFFTTRQEENGTGLGLSISYGIIKDHNGDITVSSRLNQGSTFTIMLPLLEKSQNKVTNLLQSKHAEIQL